MASAGTGTLHFDGGLVAPLSFVLAVVTWLVALALLIGNESRTALAAGSGVRRAGPSRRRRGGESEFPTPVVGIRGTGLARGEPVP